MWIAIALVIGSVLLVVGGFTWAASREAIERAETIAGLQVSEIGALAADRLVAIRGPARPARALVDPVTEEPAVLWEASIVRTGEVIWTDREGDRLHVGEAAIDLAAAELAIEVEEVETTYDEPSERMRRILAARDREIPPAQNGARWSLTHRAIAVDDELTIVGVPHKKDGESSFSTASGLLIVTREALPELARRELADIASMQWMLRIAVVAGVASLAVGGWLLAMG